MCCVPGQAWRASRSTLPMKRFARVGATGVPVAIFGASKKGLVSYLLSFPSQTIVQFPQSYKWPLENIYPVLLKKK